MYADDVCEHCLGQPRARYCPVCGALPVIRLTPAGPAPALDPRAVLIAFGFGDIDVPEAAELLGVSPRAAVAELSRARVRALTEVRRVRAGSTGSAA